jgi:hypothetical protein
MRTQFSDASRDVVEAFTHGCGKLSPWLGQHHAAAASLEQGNAQLVLQRLHLVTDRAMGQVQLCRGPAEVELPGGDLESTQRVQGRQAWCHMV